MQNNHILYPLILMLKLQDTASLLHSLINYEFMIVQILNRVFPFYKILAHFYCFCRQSTECGTRHDKDTIQKQLEWHQNKES